jgi:hypothetical protein
VLIIPTGVAATIQFTSTTRCLNQPVASTHLVVGGAEATVDVCPREPPQRVTVQDFGPYGRRRARIYTRPIWSGTEPSPTGCPAFDSLCEATTEEDDFTAPLNKVKIITYLRGGQYIFGRTLRSILITADCSCQAKASGLAILMINEIRRMEGTVPPPSAQELQEELQDQKKGLHVVLAFLWAVSQKLLQAAPLTDTPESDQLNHQCELIRRKVRPNRATVPGAGNGPHPGRVTPPS